jgi:membrane protein YdbS with pleckstrin-like domain
MPEEHPVIKNTKGRLAMALIYPEAAFVPGAEVSGYNVPVGYAEKQLAPGEQILYRARYHWVFFGKAILLVLASIGLSAVDLWLLHKGVDPAVVRVLAWVTGATLVFALLVFVSRSIHAAADEFVVTDRRIIHKLGVLSHETRQCPLARVQDITVDQSFWGRLLGYGDLGIETASEGGQILFPTISNPEALRTAIWTHVGTGGVSTPGPAASGPASAAAPAASERLARLNELKSQGLITPEEFEAKRRDVVKDL